jgi:hypothetical protein
MREASWQSLSQINWKTMMRDGAASTEKADVQISDSIMLKMHMQPVDSRLPIVLETGCVKASKF